MFNVPLSFDLSRQLNPVSWCNSWDKFVSHTHKHTAAVNNVLNVDRNQICV